MMRTTLSSKDVHSEASARRLRNCPLFDGMDDEHLADVAKLCTWLHLASGQIAPTRPQETYFIVCHGKLRVSALTAIGRELLLADFEQGDSFGGVNLMGNSVAAMQVQGIGATILACLARNELFKLIEKDAVFREGLFQTQQCVTERLVNRVIELGTLKLSGRLYSYLLQLAERAGIENNRASLVPAPPHQELAARIAASREEVSRELARLRKQGLISSSRQAMVLQDITALKERLQEQ